MLISLRQNVSFLLRLFLEEYNFEGRHIGREVLFVFLLFIVVNLFNLLYSSEWDAVFRLILFGKSFDFLNILVTSLFEIGRFFSEVTKAFLV